MVQNDKRDGPDGLWPQDKPLWDRLQFHPDVPQFPKDDVPSQKGPLFPYRLYGDDKRKPHEPDGDKGDATCTIL